MNEFSLKHVSSRGLSWQRVDVYGAATDKATVFEAAHGVRSALFRMSAGCIIPEHTHTKWVQVMVLEGCMLVTQGEDRTGWM